MGFIQGVLEWLPVSSEGQLVLVAFLFEEITEADSLKLAFWLHLGTMVAVLINYRDEWFKIIDLQNDEYKDIRSFIILSTIGTGIAGIPTRFLLMELINTNNFGFVVMWIIGISLIITGILLHYSQLGESERTLEELSSLEKIIVGFFQGLTIIPGISRSGTTVSVLLFLKVKPQDSFRGSFLMSVPAVIGAILLDMISSKINNESLIGELWLFGIFTGILVAFFMGILTMKGLILIAKKYSFSYFTITMGFVIIIAILIFSL